METVSWYRTVYLIPFNMQITDLQMNFYFYYSQFDLFNIETIIIKYQLAKEQVVSVNWMQIILK